MPLREQLIQRGPAAAVRSALNPISQPTALCEQSECGLFDLGSVSSPELTREKAEQLATKIALAHVAFRRPV